MNQEAVCRSLVEYLTSVVLLEVDRTTPLTENDLIDSFDRVGLIGHLEQLLDISVDAEHFADIPFENIDSIANWALQHKASL